jgi:chromosome partitioning protein
MIPSSPWIAASDRDEDIAISSGVISMLEHLPPSWDYVLVDCPPSHGALSVAPLAACPAVIIPVETRVLALTGLVSTLETIEAVRERLNPQLTVDAIIASRVNRTRHAQEIVERLRERYSELVLDVEIRETTDLATAPSFQLPVTRYAPDGAGAADFRALAREILDRDRLADLQDDPSIADFTLGSRGPGLRALSTAS